MSAPQDTRVDRRAFLARMGVLGSAAALGGLPVPAGGRAQLPSRASDSRAFWDSASAMLRTQEESPAEQTAWEAGVLLRRGELTVVELVEACLDRIERWDATYLAFNTVTAEAARARARHLDAEGPSDDLHGIPIVVKDNYYSAGVPTTANSHIFRDFVPEWSATALERLEAAGAVLLGKSQMGPLATTRALTPDGDITTVNAWAPFNPRVSPGGSSSGSATSVAARMVLSSIGTQTGGSITVPSLAQGLTGLKPTMGRVSLRGVIPLTYSRDHPGPLARDARDAALMLQAMAGPDPADPRTLGLPEVPDYLTAATPTDDGPAPRLRWPTRIGVPAGWADDDGPEGEARRAFLDAMEDAGARRVDLEFSEPWEELSSRLFNSVRLPERTEPFLEHLRRDVRLFGVSLNTWMQGLFMSGDEYLKGQRARHALLRRTLDEIFAECDVVAPPGHVPFDMIGLPLMAFPVGMRDTDDGPRPFGILLGAPPFGEERLLSVAAAWQARTDHHRARPPRPDARSPVPPGARGRMGPDEVAMLSE